MKSKRFTVMHLIGRISKTAGTSQKLIFQGRGFQMFSSNVYHSQNSLRKPENSNKLKFFDPKWVNSNYTFIADANPIDCASSQVQSLVKNNHGEDIHCADERCEQESHIHFTCYNPAELHGVTFYDLR